MAHNVPHAGTWRSGPGNWRVSENQRQPSFRSTKTNARGGDHGQTVGISGKVEMSKVSGRRLRYTRTEFVDPMLTEPITTGNAYHRERIRKLNG